MITNTATNLPAAAVINVLSGGTLFISGAGINVAATVQATGTGNSEGFGAIRVDTGATLSGNVTLVGNATLGSVNGVGTISGAIMGNFNMTKVGPGPLILLGTNGYTGITSVTGGLLQFGSPNAVYGNNPSNWLPSNLIFNSGTTLGLNVGGNSDFSAASAAALIGNLSTVAGNGLLAGSSILFDTSNATSVVPYSTAIVDSVGTGGGAINVVKAGAGTLILSGANSYTGTSTASVGTLEFATPGSLYNLVTANWVPAMIISYSGATLALAVGGPSDFALTDAQTILTNLSTVSSNGLKSGSLFGIDTTNDTTELTWTQAIVNSTGHRRRQHRLRQDRRPAALAHERRQHLRRHHRDRRRHRPRR